MKRTIIISAVAIIFWVAGSVGAALLLPLVPPIQHQRPLPLIEVDARVSLLSPAERPETIENRVLADAVILSQA